MRYRISISILALILLIFLTACSKNETLPIKTTPQIVNEGQKNTEIKKVETVTPIITSPSTPTEAPKPNTETPKEISTSKFIKDGTYEENASYISPDQTEHITFAFTVKEGVLENIEITKSDASPELGENDGPFDGVSLGYQKDFIKGIKPLVIGKKLSEIGTFDRVGGSSLTPAAFNQAIAKLKAQG